MKQGIGREFMKRTRHRFLDVADQQRGLAPPPLAWVPPDNAAVQPLPDPRGATPEPVDFAALVAQRTSLRHYAETPLTLEALSFLLWSTQGVKEVLDGGATLRTVPSAGARHAFETWVLANRVDALDAGLYRYAALGHGLVPTGAEDAAARITAACYGQTFLQTAAAVFVWVALPYRMTWRYEERGYRYLHLDAGHVAQNLYLAAEALGGGVCAVAAFDDDELNGILGLDGEDAFVVYLAAAGLKP